MPEFTLDNAISTFFSTLEYQNNYWTLYSAVAFGILAFLGASRAQLPLIRLTIISFIAFAISNLVVICYIQSNLVVISDGIIAYLDENQANIPQQFHQILRDIGDNTKPIWLVFL